MAEFFTNLLQSIFTPGPTPSLIYATNASFAGLQIVLLLLLWATYSLHFLVLSFLSAGLWWAINWFVRELNEVQRKEAERNRELGADGDGVEDSTDAETVVEAEGVKGGEGVRKRDGGEVSSSEKSEISTEDEWEKVSENEKDK